jgi:hypothetical protein
MQASRSDACITNHAFERMHAHVSICREHMVLTVPVGNGPPPTRVVYAFATPITQSSLFGALQHAIETHIVDASNKLTILCTPAALKTTTNEPRGHYCDTVTGKQETVNTIRNSGIT